ncbi:MAG: XRE family transcriptional regulator [Eubacteriales bacterium]|nr:XRE family transcriptional regulator [Clostridiales bacterium]MDD4745167.1 XRE family transcriptional regulator [Eubacteriales bacterium]NLO37601.1 ImmA/IrrE family metallo-endopeptidase [Clostridiaceae bacterium]
MEMMAISSNLCRIRKDKRLSQTKLAEMAGLSRIAYRNIETGISRPKVSTLQNLAAALGVKTADLVLPVKVLQHVRFRSLKRMNSRTTILAAVGKWLENYTYLEELAGEKVPYPFDGFQNQLSQDLSGAARAKEAAQLARKTLGIDYDAKISDMADLVEDHGIKLYPIRLVSDGFFGLSVSAHDGGPAIVVNVWERISVERWIFSTAHELGHLLLHLDSYAVEQAEEDQSQEIEANIFASHFLMPEASFASAWRDTAGLDLVERVLKIKNLFHVSYKTVLYRLSDRVGDGIWVRFNHAYAGKVGRYLKKADEPMALSPSHFCHDPEILKANEPEAISQRHFVEDRLLRLVRIAVESNQISLGRGAEILGYDLIKMREMASSWV